MASIESKIRDMINRKADVAESYPGMGNNKEAAAMAQGSSETPTIQMMNVTGAAKPGNPVNNLAAGAGAMESKPMKQGSSQDAAIDSEDDETTQGKTQASKAKKQPVPTTKGAGAAPNYTTHADPTSVVNQASSAGNVYKEEVEENMEEEELFISEEEYNALSEEEQAEFEAVEVELEEDATEEVEEDEEEELEENLRRSDKKGKEIFKQAFGGNKPKKNAFVRSLGSKGMNDANKLRAGRTALLKKEEVEEEVEESVKDVNKPLKNKFKQNNRIMAGIGKPVPPEPTKTKKFHKSYNFDKMDAAANTLRKEELSKDIENLLSTESELSEEFKTKATSLFEAVVTARVAHEVEIMEDVLAEQAAEVVAEMHQELVDKVDAYLNYVVEQWVEQNALAIENGLRTEVTEDFIAGLKVLFQENYIEVPEERYDVLGEMQNKIEELTAVANEAFAEAVELKKALTESKRDAVLMKVTSDLAQTESEKLRGLVEEVEFDTPELFEQKLTVIKSNYFPKAVVENATLPEEQPIVEETSGSVAQYAARISRTKF